MNRYITWPYQIADHNCRITWVYNKTQCNTTPLFPHNTIKWISSHIYSKKLVWQMSLFKQFLVRVTELYVKETATQN